MPNAMTMCDVSTPVRPEQPEGVDRAIDVVGNRVKVAALRSLLSDGSATQTELAERLGVQRPLLRKHLVVLEQLGVVQVHPSPAEPDARRRRYSAVPAEVERVVADLRAGLGLS